MKSRHYWRNLPNVTKWKPGVSMPPDMFAGSTSRDRLEVLQQVTGSDRIAPNPYSYWKVFSTGLSGQSFETNPAESMTSSSGGFPSDFGNDGEIFGSSSFYYPHVRNEAIASLAKSVRGGLDVSVDLFQAQKTYQTVSSLINPVRYLAASLKNASQGGIATEKQIGAMWLTWVYGVKPTLQTLYELMEKIRSEVKAARPLVHYRARGIYVDNRTVNFQTSSFAYQTVQAKAQVSTSVRCQIDVYLKPSTSVIAAVGDFTSLNPASIAWELMPYSFVVDWFYNVGGFLRSLETTMLHANRFHSGTETYSVKKDSACITPSLKAGTVIWTGMSARHEFRAHDRRILTGLPYPSVPRFEAKLGSTRMLNAAALLSQFTNPKGFRRI